MSTIDNDPKLSPNDKVREKKEVCHSILAARQRGFSAMDWLPYPAGETRVGTSSQKDLDWTSIMLYASNHLTDCGMLPVLRKPGKVPISVNKKPSRRDLENLVEMYSHM